MLSCLLLGSGCVLATLGQHPGVRAEADDLTDDTPTRRPAASVAVAGAGRTGGGQALQVPRGHARRVRDGVRHRELGRVAVLQEYLKLDLDVCMDVSTGRIPRPGDHTDRDHRPLRLLRSLAPTPSRC